MATLTYTPRKLGFELELTAGGRLLRVIGADLDDTTPEVTGSSELIRNLALVTLVLGYAANELAYRRSRASEKRESHRKGAEVERKEALARYSAARGAQDVSSEDAR